MNCFNLTKLLLGFLFILISSSVIAQERTVTGKVTDPEGKPVQGVTVKIKNTTNSTITNANGEFSIRPLHLNLSYIFSHIICLFRKKSRY